MLESHRGVCERPESAVRGSSVGGQQQTASKRVGGDPAGRRGVVMEKVTEALQEKNLSGSFLD